MLNHYLDIYSVEVVYRHSSIYAVIVGTHKKTGESENHVTQGYLVKLKGRKIGKNHKPH